MSEIGEALGTAVEGGLFARAVSGDAGKVPAGGTPLDKGHFAENACLNCGTQLIGSHCHSCGQQAHLHRTMGAFLHDLLHGALHFDGKTWRTLPKLIFKPGELTRRYIEGERTRFVSPMALFLFSIFLMFAVFQLAGISAPTDFGSDETDEVMSQARKQIGSMQERRDNLAATIEAGEIPDDELATAQAELKEFDDQLAALEAAGGIPVLRDLVEKPQNSTRAVTDEDGNTILPLTDEDGGPTMKIEGSDVGWINEAVGKWRKNPGLMLYKLQTNFYKFSWLLIPLSIPFVWLLFAWKRRFKAYDHAIFVTYSLSFMTLLTLTVTVAGLLGMPTDLVVLASLVIPPIHLYKHLRWTYGLSRFSAIWRLAIMAVFIVVILALFLQLLLVLGAF